MTSMKAVRIHNYGGPDVLAYEDAPRPTPGPGEVLIRVHATTVNPFDCAARAGYMTGYFNNIFPLVIGTDVSGVPPRRPPVVNVVLFALTFITTSMGGAFQVGADPIADPATLSAGFPFSVTLMGILLIHELGHYTLSRVHGVRATLPYFIPGPPVLIGTFGAFIRMKSPPPSRRALFDVGAAGPWAGFLVVVPAVYVGLCWSDVRPLGLHAEGLVLGDSILFAGVTRLALGTTPDQVTILLHPVALAGWFGLFVTFLNLLPVGQLDGGHVAYAMFGRWQRAIARVFVAVIVVLGWRGWEGWFMWEVLLMLIGVDHPPTTDALTPLDPGGDLACAFDTICGSPKWRAPWPGWGRR